LLPVACALGKRCEFLLRGRLPDRPITALWEVLESHGITISGRRENKLSVSGSLKSGIYTVPGNISSQYITGLLLALPLLKEKSEIHIIGVPQSKSYIDITLSVIRQFGIKADIQKNKIFIDGNQKYVTPKFALVEGDWSNSALWLSAAAVGGNVTVTGLSHLSLQGDKAVCDILEEFGARVIKSENRVSVSRDKLHGIEIDAAEIPDLVPALSIAAAGALGETVITNAGRLRYKESDRLHSISHTLSLLGADARVEDETLFITGNPSLNGGAVDSFNDHRIAMMAALTSVICKNNVTIDNAQSIAKSYPLFFEDFRRLGGNIKEE
ncbi:MAG TPA: 3-phosphoshikimate 1-carboxyvinyltransferase, partial [Clostridiales bacterium]|nr:3-phosphoshikimate 1-carboxyvinyltransferase [Clostridiales bacterium]